jgi:hypothetical protein
MNETRDYSALPAVVERLQVHGNSMESALYEYSDFKRWIVNQGEKDSDERLSDAEFREKVIEKAKAL